MSEGNDIDDSESDSMETVSTTVEVEVDVRVPTEGAFSFDPLAEQLVSGTVGDVDVSTKHTRVRDEMNSDLLTEFGSLTHEGQVGVFVPMNEVVGSAVRAVEQVDGVELPDAGDDE